MIQIINVNKVNALGDHTFTNEEYIITPKDWIENTWQIVSEQR